MSAWGVTDFWTYLVGAIAIILLPGPNSLYVLSIAAARGVRAGYQAAFGVFAGDTVLLLLTALGAASVLRAYPAVFLVVKYAGAAYLAWVGFNLLRQGWLSWRRGADADVAAPATVPPGSMQQPFRRALLVSLLNPKAIIFLLSFFIQFIDPNYPHPSVPFLILSAVVMVSSAIYLSVLIVVGSRVAGGVRRWRRTSAGLSAGVGGLFIGFGAKLATATLT